MNNWPKEVFINSTYHHENMLKKHGPIIFCKKSTLCTFHVSLYLARVTFWISASHFSKFRTLTQVMTRANQFENRLKTRTHSSHKIADSSHHYKRVRRVGSFPGIYVIGDKIKLTKVARFK
jgi:hypothetical protein